MEKVRKSTRDNEATQRSATVGSHHSLRLGEHRDELERLLKREQAKLDLLFEKRRLAGVGVESSMKKPNGSTIFDKDPELLLSSDEETDGEFDRQGEEEQSQIEMGGKKKTLLNQK